MPDDQSTIGSDTQPIVDFESKYAVDLVFCLDATKSMGGIIDATKERCRSMLDDVVNLMKEGQKPLSALRAGVVEFRDLEQDKGRQMVAHDFTDAFDPATDAAKADKFVETLSKIEAKGGGDPQESALDALCKALQFPWYVPAPTEAVKTRRIVVLFTDNPPRAIHASTKAVGEESLADKDIVLNRFVTAMQGKELRVLIVGPECPEYTDLTGQLPYAKHLKLDPGEAERGVFKVDDFQPIYAWIVASITS